MLSLQLRRYNIYVFIHQVMVASRKWPKICFL